MLHAAVVPSEERNVTSRTLLMTTENTFLTGKIMEIGSQLSALSTKLDGFMASQTAVRNDIAEVRKDVEAVEDKVKEVQAELASFKAEVAGKERSRRDKIAGATKVLSIAGAVAGSVFGFFQFFVWPFIRSKLGI